MKKLAIKTEEKISIKYYHILIDNWFDNTLVANGVEVESYYNKKFKDFLIENSIDHIDFLKVDCEGGEYDILKNIVNNYMRIIGITMEIHDVSGQREKFVQAMKHLQTKYTIVHMHGNTYAGDTLNGVPMLLTDAMEFTMVRKEFCTSTELRKQVFIQGLDQGNCPNFKDIEYYY